ncbi:TonB-dependent receptor domain-containing protein [Labilibaculum sp.]|uniref:TonB-dependent receptor n=1 Tax=Labilibaculum sp. TaxID=2060723 RepID=UPI00356574DD
MKIKILSILLSLLPLFSFADMIKGRVIEKSSTEKTDALPGASIFWKNTNQGTISDSNGNFELTSNNESNILVVQFVGYTSQQIQISKSNKNNLIIKLEPNIELNEVLISSRKLGTTIDRDNPMQSQSITGAELCKAACCNLSESFETNASVDVSYADAATGAKSIKLLGLTGKYIEMMTEKNPNFKGLASVYGMAYVPGPWMESIQVSKGVGSVVNGYESITGQINIEYQKPQTAAKFYVNSYANSMGMAESNAMIALKLSSTLSTSILAHVQDNDKEIDKNHDDFLDDPMVTQYNFMNRWNWDISSNFKSQFGFKFIDEQRIGGQTDYNPNELDNNSNAYQINIDTRRYEAFAKLGYLFPKDINKSIALITNFASHEQNSFYGTREYNADQKYFYANLLFQSYFGNIKHKYTAGLSYIHDDFKDILTGGLGTNRIENVAGVYAEYTWLPSNDLTFQTGLRYDDHNIYGGFLTPRLHIRYQFTPKSTFRIAAGSGRRTANPISENSFLLASNRSFEIADDLQQEKAWNFGFSLSQYFSLFGIEFSALGDFYRTTFDNQVIVDLDKSVHSVSFYNLDGKSWANNYQIELKFEPINRFNVTTAIRFSDVKTDINQEFVTTPYVNRYKGLINLSYASKFNKWQFDITSQLNGDMRIPSTKENPSQYQRREKSPVYALLNAQVTKRFRIWELYVGAENISNYTQKNPIIQAENPFGEYFDASMIWGPIQERKFYAGIRLTIQ